MNRRDWAECAGIAAIAVALLLPFVAKPIHLDDPMYLWAARHIQAHPLDFYGFSVNWYGFLQPMAEANYNPPLISFYLAAVAALFGWSEPALHAALLVPAIAALLAVRALARDLGAQPVGAALTTLAMPAFLVSSTTLMADILMLSFWCGALALWVRGFATGRNASLLGAAVLAGLCPLAKYSGASVIPLLFAYAAWRERRIGRWVWLLSIPVALLVAYDALYWALYGVHAVSGAATYTLATRARTTSFADQLLVGLLFLGGCLIAPLVYAPFLWKRRGVVLGALATIGVVAVWVALGDLAGFRIRSGTDVRWDIAVQMVFFLGAAIHLFALATSDLFRRRDAGAVLLFLWVAGIFVFASVVNWTTNARAVLPAAPAAAILCWRRLALEPRFLAQRRLLRLAPLVPAAALSLAVAWGDQQLAVSAREAVATVIEHESPPAPGKLWFEGAWGFQYYMEARGARRIAVPTDLEPGDRVVTPGNNVQRVLLPSQVMEHWKAVQIPVRSWVATFSRAGGAGFYASEWGPLPFVLGPVPPELYAVDVIRVPVRLRGPDRPAEGSP